MSNEFLNFAEISKGISFRDVLDWLNISYTQKNKELRGEGFIVNIDKNLFFTHGDDEIKGSVINFVAHYKKIDLRDAASQLKQKFLAKSKEYVPKREVPNLTLDWDDYIKERGITAEVANEYEIGLVKQRSVVAGRIAFKVYDSEGNITGYIGYKPTDNTWFYPKGFKRPLYNAHRLKHTDSVIVTTDPFDALRIVSMGFNEVASLLANSMTSEQEVQLKKFRYILLFHKEPENIANRLFKSSFIKAPVLSKPLKEWSDTEIKEMIKPSS